MSLLELERLSRGQQAAVMHEDGPAAVYAGPGSGKTRVVTIRAARMALAGRRLLVTTFTSDATEEMRMRLAALGVPGAADSGAGRRDRSVGLARPLEPPGAEGGSVYVTTLHALCLQLLRLHGRPFRLLADEHLRRNLAEAALAAELEGGVNGFLQQIGVQKNRNVSVTAFTPDGSQEERDFARVWRAYEKQKAEKGLLEFDDLILEALSLLEADDAFRCDAARRFTHLLVDECQDMNTPQYRVIFALGRDHKNVMLVGDLDQSLYGFRGADTQTFRGFADHSRTKVYELRENYRCTRHILTFADSLIRQNQERRALVFLPTRPEGEPVAWMRYPDADLEALAAGEQILRLARSGAKFGEIAVLYRTNAQSEAPERHFAALKIPYSVRESGDFYARTEVQGILAYLQFFAAAGRNGASGSADAYPDEWLLALLNVPKRDIRRETGAALRNHAALRGRRIWDILPEFQAADLRTHRSLRQLRQDLQVLDGRLSALPHAGEAIRIIRAATDFDGWLRRSGRDDKDNDRIQNLQSMQAAASHYATIGDYVQAIQRVRDEAARRKTERARKRRQLDEVTLSTGHAAKGMEWRYVFTIGWSEQLLPHRKATDIEEERRIAYVMATRARDRLTITSPDSWNEATVAPSRFLTSLQLLPTPPPEFASAADSKPVPAAAEEPEQETSLGGLFL